MKNKNVSLKWLLIPLILLLLAVGGFSAQAQADDQPLDDEFVFSLVIMTVNHNLMSGRNEVRDLTALKDYVNQYYEDRLAVVNDPDDHAWLGRQKFQLNQMLEDKIDNRVNQDAEMIDFFIDLFSTADDSQGSAQQAAPQRLHTISGSDDPPQDYFEVMESMVMTDIELQVNLLLDIDIINTQPSLAPAIADSSGWSYNVPAITDSSSPITPASGNDGSGGADFWGDAGSGDGDGGIGGDSSAPISGGDDGDSVILYKPLRFINHGFEPVTVLVETYDPAPGYEGVPFPTASTVVFQENNPSAILSLPLGTYTFCYYWQLDEDYNNDDYFDYHHRTTATFSLNENSSDNTESAIAVGLNPDSVVSNPNGKCGESAPQSQGQNTSGLTPEEQVNAGLHTYTGTCVDIDWCGDDSAVSQLQTDFSANGVTITNITDGADPQFFEHVGTNTYTWTNAYGDVFYLKFNMDGLSYSFSDGSGFFAFTLQD